MNLLIWVWEIVSDTYKAISDKILDFTESQMDWLFDWNRWLIMLLFPIWGTLIIINLALVGLVIASPFIIVWGGIAWILILLFG